MELCARAQGTYGCWVFGAGQVMLPACFLAAGGWRLPWYPLQHSQLPQDRASLQQSQSQGGWMRCVRREHSLDQSRKVVSQSCSCFLLFSFLTHPLSLSLTVILPAPALAEEERQVCGREARASVLSAEAGHGQGAGRCQLRWLLQTELGAKEKQVLWHCRSFQRGHHQDCLA